ncbi:hypothetical protein [Flavobacterium cellulosilyticum]|uniref:hypothetical protein n=1 Tax=Flavobacterium cellulosilyticum TaxID=2541731 RepID=UPI001FEB2A76|nr:hypothetical protein [Flavobacterium cellulosilyticum]
MVALLGFISCQSQNITKSSTNSGAYDEISMKEGDKWDGRKYIGGTFKNVTTLKLAPEHTDHSFDIRYEG